jgi:hypothetical protein
VTGTALHMIGLDFERLTNPFRHKVHRILITMLLFDSHHGSADAATCSVVH